MKKKPVHEQRITPACAGNSLLIQHIGDGFRDHPRMRGEQTKKIPMAGRFSLRRLADFNEFLIKLFGGKAVVFRAMSAGCFDVEMGKECR